MYFVKLPLSNQKIMKEIVTQNAFKLKFNDPDDLGICLHL